MDYLTVAIIKNEQKLYFADDGWGYNKDTIIEEGADFYEYQYTGGS